MLSEFVLSLISSKTKLSLQQIKSIFLCFFLLILSAYVFRNCRSDVGTEALRSIHDSQDSIRSIEYEVENLTPPDKAKSEQKGETKGKKRQDDDSPYL